MGTRRRQENRIDTLTTQRSKMHSYETRPIWCSISHHLVLGNGVMTRLLWDFHRDGSDGRQYLRNVLTGVKSD